MKYFQKPLIEKTLSFSRDLALCNAIMYLVIDNYF
jgi:hypothetical protein